MAREGGISRGACEGGQSASSASQGTNRFLKQGSSSGRRRYAGALLQNRYALESRVTQRRPFAQHRMGNPRHRRRLASGRTQPSRGPFTGLISLGD